MITLHSLSQSDYNKLVAKLLGNFEADRSTAYFDSRPQNRHVTIGRGFDIESEGIARREVFRVLQLGQPSSAVTPQTDAAEKAYVARIVAVLTGPDTTNASVQTALDQIMSQRAADPLFASIPAISSQTTFNLTPAQIEKVFTAIIEDKEGIVDRNIANRSLLPPSSERAALISIAYQGLVPSRSAALKTAIVTNSDRAEAWYLIRYKGYSGPADGAGQAKRHYAESQAFGLYADPSIASENEAKQVFAMLSRNRGAIVAYEASFGVSPDSATSDVAAKGIAAANNDYHLSGSSAVQTLTAILKAARDAFIGWVNTQLPAEQTPLVASDWNPAAIFYGNLANSLPGQDARSLDGKGNGMENNLLVGDSTADFLRGGAGNDVLLGQAGQDFLEGGAGNDLLIGGDADDVLVGGAGDDTLIGGAGDDTYVIHLSDGPQHDTIVDSDGTGTLIVYGADGARLNTVILRKDGAANAWSDNDGQVTISHNSPWKITLADGSVIELGENFNAAGFGITLQDKAAEATSTLTGEFAKSITGDRYTLAPTGYASAGAQAGAFDILNGTSAAEELFGLAGNDGLSGGDGDDLLDGGTGDDLLLGGRGADTLRGGAGNDFIYGSATGLIATPGALDFTPPSIVPNSVEAARGFSWVASRAVGQRWSADGYTASMLDVEITGADVTPGYVIGGQAYVETSGNVIDAGEGDDYVAAGMGADVVRGGDGDDDLYGMGDNDVLFGDEGSDFIRGDGVASADSGHSTPDVLHGNDILVGGAGRDVLIGQGGADELYGGTEDDMLWGDDTSLTDTPLAVHGNDYLDGGDGADRLEGGGLDDELYGGAGNDRLWGDGSTGSGVAGAYQGKDYLDGEDGDDQLTGGGNDDQLFGGIGNDLLWGDDGQSNTPLADQGRDYLDGEEGNDQLIGGGNADTLYGGDGDDVMLGDDDTARVAAASHGDDYLDGEAGNDSLFGGGGNDVLSGSEGNDYLNGDDDTSRLGYSAHGNDTLDGGEGNDELVGAGGSDLLVGGAGDDVLQGDEIASKVDVSVHGNDTLDGGEGNDTLFGGGAADELLGGSGNDWLYGDGTLEDVPSVAHGNDLLDGGEGNDLLLGQGGNDTLLGGLGADTLQGGTGDDSLEGGDGVDGLFGGAGDDVLISDGQDYLDGGEGDDTYRIAAGSSGAVATYNDASGNNTVYIAGANAASSQIFAQNGSWYLTTGGGGVIGLGGNASLAGMLLKSDERDVGTSTQAIADRASTGGLVRSGSWNGTTVTYTRNIATAQTLTGTERAEWLEGGAGVDNLTAGGGNDRLDGGAGADALYGGTGADTIAGGQGNDSLWAANASGANDREQDVFVFARGDGSDYIRFSALPADGVKDVIRFDTGITRGDITVSAILSTDGSNAAPRLRISYGGTDRISLEAGAEGTIEGLHFADGSSMAMAEVLQLLPAAPGGRSVVTEGDDFLLGTPLNDDLRGRGGNDTLVGGGGDDVLQGNGGRNVYQFAGAIGKDVILPTRGEQATLVFSDADAGSATVRLEGDNLVFRMGADNSVQVVGFKALADAPRNWFVQFGQGEPITIEALLLDSAISDPAALGDRRDRFLAQQRVELQTLPQRVFQPEYAAGQGAVPVSLTQSSVSVDAGGSLALPDSLSLSTQSFTAVYRYKKEVVELVKYVGPVFDNGVAFVSVEALGTGYYSSLVEPVPLYGPPGSADQSGGTGSDNLGKGAFLGYFVRNAWVTSEPQYRVVGYTDEVQTTTTTIAADTANQTQAAGSAGSDYIFSPSVAQFRGAIDAGAGDDYVYLNSVTDSWGFDQGVYTDRLDSNRDWAPLANGNWGYVIPSLYAYRERGLGAWIDAGGGNDVVLGTDAADTIIGGRGSDHLNGQAGADTYLIGRDVGSVDRINDTAAFQPDDQTYYFLYGGSASDFHQDTVEFEADVDRSRMSYKWLPDSGNELELYLDGQLFLQVSYDNDGSAGLAGAAGIERFVFSNGEVFSLEQLRAVLPLMPSHPAPVAPQVVQPLLDASVDEDAAILAIDVRTAFVDPQGGPLGFQVSTVGGKPLPSWLSFDAATGRLTGVPANDDVGAITVTVVATGASGLTAQDQFDIEVRNVNDAPTVVSVPAAPLIVEEGTSLKQTLDWFGDVDVNDTLNMAIAAQQGGPLPAWISFDAATKVLSALPPLGALGPLVVKVTATDSAGLTASAELVINVRASEPMLLIGTAGVDTLLGHSGDDVLNGKEAADSMTGGLGNDTYVVDNLGDVVNEAAGQGMDRVESSVSFALPANVENIWLIGSGKADAMGNDLNNVLKGNDGINRLVGGAGDDTLEGGAGDMLIGGTGNDTYVLGPSVVPWPNSADSIKVTENLNEGVDTIRSFSNWTLAKNFENLVLVGTAAVIGSGNAGANTLIGNANSNQLYGWGGDDVYDGALGNDYLVDADTNSNDTYRWGLGMGTDTVFDLGGTLDHVDLFAGITKDQLTFSRSAVNLELQVTGQTDKLVMAGWYLQRAHQIEEFRLSDGSKVLASEVQGLISAMAGFAASEGMMTTGNVTPSMHSMPAWRHLELAASTL